MPDNTCSAGTRAIISAMKKTGVKRMVVCSSWGVGPGNRTLLNCFI
ncbi:MAG: NAD(P)H-binding protein [bacterium]